MQKVQSTLIDFIKNTFPIRDEAASIIANHFTATTFTKNQYILKKGKICSDYIFLESGCMRAFTYNAEEDEVTTAFFTRNQMVFEVASYFQRTPSKEAIQALTDCTAWVGSYDAFQSLFHSLPEFREFGRAILVKGFVALKERTLSMINNTAEQRYASLLQDSSDVLQYVPLKHIASYLGVTDTSLSRIRKELTQK